MIVNLQEVHDEQEFEGKADKKVTFSEAVQGQQSVEDKVEEESQVKEDEVHKETVHQDEPTSE